MESLKNRVLLSKIKKRTNTGSIQDSRGNNRESNFSNKLGKFDEKINYYQLSFKMSLSPGLIMAIQETLNNLPQAVPNSELVPLKEIVFTFARTARYSSSDFRITGRLLDKRRALTFPVLKAFITLLNPNLVFPLFITIANYELIPSVLFFPAISLIYILFLDLI